VLAEHDGKVILIEQYRVPVGGRCLELPAGLVGDEDEHATVEDTAVKELEEETGFTCDRVERLGEFHSSPGMVAESFTLVRAHGVRKVGDGGGNHDEDITVFLVPRDDIPEFIAQRRAAGSAVDVKLLLFADY
jgi:ADP-ribose pyrophosphatase